MDGGTVERGKNCGLDVNSYLSTFDAYTFFNRTGDAIVTGPTGNNLRDLRILLAVERPIRSTIRKAARSVS